MSFANLKKQSKLGSLTEKLVKEVQKMDLAELSDLFKSISESESYHLGRSWPDVLEPQHLPPPATP